MDWVTIISGIGSFICGGGLVTLFTLRQTRTGKDIENISNIVELQNKTIERQENMINTKVQRIDELERSMQSLQNQFIQIQGELNSLRIAYTEAKVLQCNKIKCPHREPKIDVNKYQELIGELKQEQSK